MEVSTGRSVQTTHDFTIDIIGLGQIRLADSPIPLEIIDLEHSEPRFTDSVIQDSLEPFLPDTDPVVTNVDNPLLRLKIHLSSSSSIIGVAWHHTLGDAATLLRFMIALSDGYQGLTSDSSTHPTFRKYHFPEPDQMKISKWLPHMSHLAHTYPASEIGAKYTEGGEVIVPIRAIIRRTDADALRKKMHSMLDINSKVQLSIQDCLTATIVTTINSVQPNTVQKVTNVAGFRQVTATWNDSNIAGNSIYIVSTPALDPERSCDPTQIARIIRESLLATRTAEYVEEYMSVAGHKMALAAESERHFFFGSERNTISVNSNMALHWQKADFGCPATRFFTATITRFYMRVFPANTGEAIDLTFGAPESLRQDIIQRLGPEFMIVQ
ncbi:hypothetical protein D9757_001671 [Collybiopsis confluens]|uniref:Uncharacterized protein n=1 Tax=Collybiopsis confluens TaxID=2823264 RepID=A0A8H5MF89_9AGAR|nr:hypothetical protein D9757_001671 [Collybiopsis confluens]